jgi:hypothetical protein
MKKQKLTNKFFRPGFETPLAVETPLAETPLARVSIKFPLF